MRNMLGLVVAALALAQASPASAASRILTTTIEAKSLAGNRIGLPTARQISVYLPDGYDEPGRRFPVIYYLPAFFEDHTAPFANHGAQAVLDAAIRDRAIPPVILVSADYGTPMGGSWFVNSSVTGNWEDFVVHEVVPHVDATYRTLSRAESRGVAGDRMGGYGAIRFGMTHPEVFGSVYALHPIGTGTGLQTMLSRPDWDRLANAKALGDLQGDGFSLIFTSIFQAHLPNPGRAPLFFDPPARRVDGQLVIDPAVTGRLHDNFLLARLVPGHAANLRKLRGLKFDWARGDTNQDHIYSNQALTHILDEYGVPYEAEEYRGGWGERHWTPDGRVASDMLPFFAKTLAFAAR
ncbi:MAG: alpha/beta hydrolase-fold protein [Sphingomonas sp.]